MNPVPDSKPHETEDNEPKWWTTGWAKWAASALLIIIGFYAIEDWRGAAAWRQVRQEAIARGESLDPRKFIPPEIPDAQNFGALPIFQHGSLRSALEPITSSKKWPTIIEDMKDHDKLPFLGDWSKNEPPDVPAIRQRLIEFYLKAHPTLPLSPATPLAEIFDRICPTLAELRAANAKYPLCRFNENYEADPWARSYENVVATISLAKVLSYHERLALLDHNPDLAIEDMKIIWKVDSGIRQEPILVSGLVAIGDLTIQLQVVNEGLIGHVWNDHQLAQLDSELGKIDLMAQGPLTMRGELVLFTIPTADYFNQNRGRIRALLNGGYVPTSTTWQDQVWEFPQEMAIQLIPQGWFDQYKADAVKFYMFGVVPMMDIPARRVYPERGERAMQSLKTMGETSFWTDFLAGWFGPMEKWVLKFVWGQVRVDQARIACRLERYRLAKGAYPASLQMLVPVYGDLPNDPMSGASYIYRLNADGTYLLYSVGWNQKDDSGIDGRIIHDSGAYPDKTFDELGDWVWMNHPEKTKTK